jgi:hypothetical protein
MMSFLDRNAEDCQVASESWQLELRRRAAPRRDRRMLDSARPLSWCSSAALANQGRAHARSTLAGSPGGSYWRDMGLVSSTEAPGRAGTKERTCRYCAAALASPEQKRPWQHSGQSPVKCGALLKLKLGTGTVGRKSRSWPRIVARVGANARAYRRRSCQDGTRALLAASAKPCSPGRSAASASGGSAAWPHTRSLHDVQRQPFTTRDDSARRARRPAPRWRRRPLESHLVGGPSAPGRCVAARTSPHSLPARA